jgi:hypothetical protein
LSGPVISLLRFYPSIVICCLCNSSNTKHCNWQNTNLVALLGPVNHLSLEHWRIAYLHLLPPPTTNRRRYIGDHPPQLQVHILQATTCNKFHPHSAHCQHLQTEADKANQSCLSPATPHCEVLIYKLNFWTPPHDLVFSLL